MNQTYETKSKTHLEKPVTKVKINWRDGRGSVSEWNEICAWAIDTYGLPGSKYEWHPYEEYMEFNFYDEKDAIYFVLRWS